MVLEFSLTKKKKKKKKYKDFFEKKIINKFPLYYKYKINKYY
jgi:hypothetical protein